MQKRINAAGSGLMWHDATGWSAYTFPGHMESDKLATGLYNAAAKHLPATGSAPITATETRTSRNPSTS